MSVFGGSMNFNPVPFSGTGHSVLAPAGGLGSSVSGLGGYPVAGSLTASHRGLMMGQMGGATTPLSGSVLGANQFNMGMGLQNNMGMGLNQYSTDPNQVIEDNNKLTELIQKQKQIADTKESELKDATIRDLDAEKQRTEQALKEKYNAEYLKQKNQIEFAAAEQSRQLRVQIEQRKAQIVQQSKAMQEQVEQRLLREQAQQQWGHAAGAAFNLNIANNSEIPNIQQKEHDLTRRLEEAFTAQNTNITSITVQRVEVLTADCNRRMAEHGQQLENDYQKRKDQIELTFTRNEQMRHQEALQKKQQIDQRLIQQMNMAGQQELQRKMHINQNGWF